MLHGRPQTVLVQAEDVELGLLARSAGDDGLALVVNVEHELVGLLLAVSEQLLEDEGDIGHQVDRVVPNDDDPRLVRPDVFADDGLSYLGRRDRRLRRRAHARKATPASDGSVTVRFWDAGRTFFE